LDAGVAALFFHDLDAGVCFIFNDLDAWVCFIPSIVCMMGFAAIPSMMIWMLKELFSLPSLLARGRKLEILHASAININETDSGLKRRRN